MQATINLKQAIINKLDLLSGDKLREVQTFVDFILTYPHHQTVDKAKTDFLVCAGTWEFEPNELEDIMADIEQSRLIELEKDDILLN